MIIMVLKIVVVVVAEGFAVKVKVGRLQTKTADRRALEQTATQ